VAEQPEEISLLDEIARLALRDPFLPFAIVMGSGQRYDISARDTVAVARSVLMLMPRAGGYRLLRNALISEVIVSPGEVP
jgi:hypothetical protein